ncbi:hypothetical protein [Ammoniphilus sp. YIM 78166]|uniref:hypothetical protein n=1 Tax=Ammoniphilus sp. YIM 78166 TaxID=1644106 RepID=UPI0010702D2E|nr:hypothetical protein [Ammoniphilus sp. YIM 78166]
MEKDNSSNQDPSREEIQRIVNQAQLTQLKRTLKTLFILWIFIMAVSGLLVSYRFLSSLFL